MPSYAEQRAEAQAAMAAKAAQAAVPEAVVPKAVVPAKAAKAIVPVVAAPKATPKAAPVAAPKEAAPKDAAPKESQGFFQGAMASIKPYAAAGKLKTFEGATELVPGVKAQPAHGHTAGHSVDLVEPRDRGAVCLRALEEIADDAAAAQLDADVGDAAERVHHLRRDDGDLGVGVGDGLLIPSRPWRELGCHLQKSGTQ